MSVLPWERKKVVDLRYVGVLLPIHVQDHNADYIPRTVGLVLAMWQQAIGTGEPTHGSLGLSTTWTNYDLDSLLFEEHQLKCEKLTF